MNRKMKAKIKKLMDYGEIGENREYHYYDIFNEKTSFLLRADDRLHGSLHCPRCGARAVISSSDPHSHVYCTSCLYHFPDHPDSMKEQLENIEDELYALVERAKTLTSLVRTMKKKNNVIAKNLEDRAMGDQ